MILNHLNLAVTDLPGTVAFLERYFGMRSQGGDDRFTVLFDDYGFVLTLIQSGKGIKYPGAFHIGFGQASEEKVNEINQRLKDDGFDVKPPQHLHAYTFYVEATGGFMVEVLA